MATLADHVRRFAHMICHPAGAHLAAWITSAKATAISELRSFVTGLERDFDAVQAGLTLPYSSGAVEGQVNRIKMIKRQCSAAPSSTYSASASSTNPDKPRS